MKKWYFSGTSHPQDHGSEIVRLCCCAQLKHISINSGANSINVNIWRSTQHTDADSKLTLSYSWFKPHSKSSSNEELKIWGIIRKNPNNVILRQNCSRHDLQWPWTACGIHQTYKTSVKIKKQARDTCSCMAPYSRLLNLTCCRLSGMSGPSSNKLIKLGEPVSANVVMFSTSSRMQGKA